MDTKFAIELRLRAARMSGGTLAALAVLALGMVACTSEPPHTEMVAAAAPAATSDGGAAAASSGESAAANASVPPAASIPAAGSMPELLAGVSARIDVDQNPFQNIARVERLEAKGVSPDSRQRALDQFNLGVELQRAGDLERAITELQASRSIASESGVSLEQGSAVYEITSLLAASWMRLGEVENCAINHTSDSCILPIQGGGVHALPRGSVNAIAELDRLLRVNPDDARSRWLRNVAAMTLGTYPQSVPEPWLIPPEAFASEEAMERFTDVAPAAGVARINHAGGAAMDDLDGDGDLDIVTTSMGLSDPMAVFLNRGDGTFEDITPRAGLDGLTGGLNLITADYDNDGDTDVFVLRGAWMGEQGTFPNSLLANRGDGTFEDVTIRAGLLSFHPTQAGAWGDYNRDGFVDLYIGNETTDPAFPHANELFRNNRDGTFTNVAAGSGADLAMFSKGVVWGDYDNDGDEDIYVSIMGRPNVLLRNDSAHGDSSAHFADVTAEAGVPEPIASFPTWFFDFDNDGDLDLFAGGYGSNNPDGTLLGSTGAVAADYLGMPTEGERPRLYVNNGDGTFSDSTEAAGLWRVLLAMGANYGDLDNDGWEDLYLGTGDPDYRSLVPNRMFRNSGTGRFRDVTTAGGFGHLQKGHGIAWGDLDNDGDQDIYEVMGGAYDGDWYQNVLFENPGSSNRWVTLRPQGEVSNRSGIGARIRVDVSGPSGSRSIHRVVSNGGSFGANSLQAEIGLGDAARIDRIVVTWPVTGVQQLFEDVPMDAVYVVSESATELEPARAPRLDLADPGAGTAPLPGTAPMPPVPGVPHHEHGSTSGD